MKGKLLLLIFLMLSCMSYAQFDEARPSINAKQFFPVASSEASLRSGQVAVHIPLFSLPGKGIDIPISLSFNSEGITHESEASHIGLGWSLSAGGVITATVRGRDDNKARNENEIPWHDNDNYLEVLWNAEKLNPYDTNTVGPALRWMKTVDPSADTYEYSFLGYSGGIDFRFRSDNPTQRYGTLIPNRSFKFEQIANGYKIIDNNGVVYFFEYKETNIINTELHTTSWFLSKITTPQGGSADFFYADESFSDYTRTEHNYTPSINSKRLTRINTDYGYVDFKSESRGDKGGARISNIELYNTKNVLIKGYKLESDGYFTNGNIAPGGDFVNNRLRLDRIIEYNRLNEYLPPYKFEYSYNFSRSKSSYRWDYSNLNAPLNSWASNPTSIAVVDRNVIGYPACWTENAHTQFEYPVGFKTLDDAVDETVMDFFCLSKMTLPTGGSEDYSYEKHDYLYISGTSDKIADNLLLSAAVMGKRLKTKTITDDNGNTQYFEYKYGLHNENYQLIIEGQVSSRLRSSGLLITPSIHTSVSYKPIPDNNLRNRFQASAYITNKPQNSFPGSPVCYTEVEEILKSGSTGETNGKRIYYFKNKVAIPSVNYIYSDYYFNGNQREKANLLVPLYNKLFGKLDRYPDRMFYNNEYILTYLAYPVGEFRIHDPSKGKPVKEVLLDNQGRVVKTIENTYQYPYTATKFGWKILPFEDGDEMNRYLISITTYMNYYDPRLETRIVRNYVPESGTYSTEEESFSYTGGPRLFSSSVKLNDDERIETNYLYPENVLFATQTNLSAQASSIKKMIELNMINEPIQITQKRGGKYIEGGYTTYKQKNNVSVVDSIFNLDSQLVTTLSNAEVNASGKVVRHPDFSIVKSHTTYDENLRPINIMSRDSVATTLKWGYGGQYVIAKIENYTNSQLESNTVLNNLIKSLDSYTEITSANWTNLQNCNQSIRNNLPDTAMITTYTYNPLVGMTSITDPGGDMTCYDYDAFNRLIHIYRIRNGVKEILESYDYNYRNQ